MGLGSFYSCGMAGKRFRNSAIIPAYSDEVVNSDKPIIISLFKNYDSDRRRGLDDIFWRQFLFEKEKMLAKFDTMALGPAKTSHPTYRHVRDEYWSTLYDNGRYSVDLVIAQMNADIRSLLASGYFGRWTKNDIDSFAPRFEMMDYEGVPHIHYAHQLKAPPPHLYTDFSVHIGPRLALLFDNDDFTYFANCGWACHYADKMPIELKFVRFGPHFMSIEKEIEGDIRNASTRRIGFEEHALHKDGCNYFGKSRSSFRLEGETLENSIAKYGSVEEWINKKVKPAYADMRYSPYIKNVCALTTEGRKGEKTISIIVEPAADLWKGVQLELSPKLVNLLNWDPTKLIDGTTARKYRSPTNVREGMGVVFNYTRARESVPEFVYNKYQPIEHDGKRGYRVVEGQPEVGDMVPFEIETLQPASANIILPRETLPQLCYKNLSCGESPVFNFYIDKLKDPMVVCLRQLCAVVTVRIVKEKSGESLLPKYSVNAQPQPLLSRFFGKKCIYVADKWELGYELIHRSDTTQTRIDVESEILQHISEPNPMAKQAFEELKKVDLNESKSVRMVLPLFIFNQSQRMGSSSKWVCALSFTSTRWKSICRCWKMVSPAVSTSSFNSRIFPYK